MYIFTKNVIIYNFTVFVVHNSQKIVDCFTKEYKNDIITDNYVIINTYERKFL